MRHLFTFILLITIFSCKNEPKTDEARKPISKSETVVTQKTDSSTIDLSDISTKDFREFKVLDSRNLSKAEIWSEINSQMKDFKSDDHDRLKDFILEQDIPTLQKHIADGKFTYEELTKFYLFRIRKYDRENDLSLNSVISINPNAIKQAIKRDSTRQLYDNVNADFFSHTVIGMPILLKDNINAQGMATTAGAVALQNNITDDAYIVKQLKAKGAIILGKANLSEWAYFFCGDCPSGYSAIGGQTLNPYGRRIIDTGGSSSGSGVAVSANFCAAAIGSETSGSILSPSSQNSVVGLKPTIGLVSRSGIVPISSTLDTAGPMTKSVIDNAIVLDALFGYDTSDLKSIQTNKNSGHYSSDLKKTKLDGLRFGAPKRLLEDSLFVKALEVLKSNGAIIIEVEEEDIGLPNFIRLLNLDMKTDLPKYMGNYANTSITMRTVSDFMTYNKQDSILRMPYGQRLFKGIADDAGSSEFLRRIKDTLKTNGKRFFDKPMQAQSLDGFLSINNYHAGYAAVAEYPALTVPMGYDEKGVPKGLTFIALSLQEKQLLQWAYVYEQASKMRIAPKNYN